jgi:uncharacterized protein YxjI
MWTMGGVDLLPPSPTTTLLDAPAVGVRQRRKLFEFRNQYDLVDAEGGVVGVVEQVDQSPFTFLTRLFSDLDVSLPVTLEVKSAGGDVLVRLRKAWFRLQVDVVDGRTGRAVGNVRKRVRLGKASFDVVAADGRLVGTLDAQSWRAKDFALRAADGREVGRVTKQWRGLLTEVATDADSYAVAFAADAPFEVRQLTLAAALAVDLTMKQKDYGPSALDFLR